MEAERVGGEQVQILRSEDPALLLRSLAVGDLEDYFALVERNRSHLTRHGDFGFFLDATFEDVRARFLEPSEDNLRLGVWYSGKLIGRVDLNPFEPPRWVLGYWLDEGFTGSGLMTTACRAAVRHARALGATELYAGVTDGNEPSIRLLRRLGFEHLQDVAARSRWRLPLIDEPPPPVMLSAGASR